MASTWDDWLILKFRPDFQVKLDWLPFSAGHPIPYVYWAFANATGAPMLVMKGLAFSAVLIGAAALYSTVTRLNLLSPVEAVAAAALVWTYPGYEPWPVKANAAYVFSVALFFVGAWLLVLREQTATRMQAAVRGAALAMFFLSFALNSMMALYPFVIAGLGMAEWRKTADAVYPFDRVKKSVARLVRRYPDFLFLPLLYWSALQLFFPRRGPYAVHYGMHVPDLAEIVYGVRAFWREGYWAQLLELLHLDWPGFVILAVATGISVAGFVSIGRESCRDISGLLLAAPLVFVASALPYIIAGQLPNAHFYNTRHLLLFGLPLALASIAVGRLCRRYSRHLQFAFLGVAVAVSVALLVRHYADLETRAMRQASIAEHLKRDWPEPPARVFNLHDGFLNSPAPHAFFGISEVTGMLRTAWGFRQLAGFTLQAERPTVLDEIKGQLDREYPAHHTMDLHGPQATIIVEPTSSRTNMVTVFGFFGCQLLPGCDPRRYVHDLLTVRVELGPISGLAPLSRP